MWKRRSYHELSAELKQISDRFRRRYVIDQITSETDADLTEMSVNGIEILKILASTVRPDADYDLTELDGKVVGLLRENVDEATRTQFFVKGINIAETGAKSLLLREGLNKIIHADPQHASFLTDSTRHDLLLSGTRSNRIWLAQLSLPQLCNAIEACKDIKLNK